MTLTKTISVDWWGQKPYWQTKRNLKYRRHRRGHDSVRISDVRETLMNKSNMIMEKY